MMMILMIIIIIVVMNFVSEENILSYRGSGVYLIEWGHVKFLW
jgi:hypothetical protein